MGSVGKVKVKAEIDAFGNDVVYSTAPAIGLPVDTLPFFSLNYAIGNIYASFAEPESVIDEVLLPPGNCELAEKIYQVYLKEANAIGVKVLGGHTGCYEGIEMPIVETTARGRRFRDITKPSAGDELVLIGKPMEESRWLEYLAGISDYEVDWRSLTPVPVLKKLSKDRYVKALHDVSEGGIGGAVNELAEALNIGFTINETFSDMAARGIIYEPSYGAVLAIIERGKSSASCNGIESCTPIGEVADAGPRIEQKNGIRWELYGTSAGSWDRLLNRLNLFVKRFTKLECARELVPEVGTNAVAAPNPYSSVEEIAGIDGRIVRTKEWVRGGVARYGVSRHMALVLKEAMKRDGRIKAAVNIALNEAVVKALDDMGLSPVTISADDQYCPPLKDITERGLRSRCMIERPSIGLEGNVVILAESVDEIEKTLSELCSKLKRSHTP